MNHVHVEVVRNISSAVEKHKSQKNNCNKKHPRHCRGCFKIFSWLIN